MSCDMAASFFIYRGVGTAEAGEVKQLLHRKSESESAKILTNWQIYPVHIYLF